MKPSIIYQILEKHLLEGTLTPGEEITVKVDQTLTQDSTGTMVYLQLEALDPPSIQTELSVAYIDHNMLQTGFENADDHVFIRSVAEKRGIIYSKPGGGICHQVHLERFSRPGMILIGSDSHTPTSGAIGAISIGAGGLDVAIAMAKGRYSLIAPMVYRVELKGELSPGVNGKDVILTILQKLSVKGGVGFAMEYTGEGVKNLSVTDRATICNMGAELGATTSIFPSDERTLEYLKAQGRDHVYVPLEEGSPEAYHKTLSIDLSTIVPMVALPHSPDAVTSVQESQGVKIDQVAIGSCTNSSYSDMMAVAQILDGKTVADHVDLVISPGSATILKMLSENGALSKMISAGARILESACGPCIGMGQAPRSEGVSLRTFNRNFKGRSGTMDAKVYLVSPQTAAISALKGELTFFSDDLLKEDPLTYPNTDSYFIYPKGDKNTPVEMGPNIHPFPLGKPMENDLQGEVLLKTQDNITTDDIVPSHAKLLPYRSNIPYLAEFCFSTLVDDFAKRAKEKKGGIVLGGENYGQGSSREHAALVPLYLGVKAVIAKSFARLHKDNLINSGIPTFTFVHKEDYEKVKKGDTLSFPNILEAVKNNTEVVCHNESTGENIPLKLDASPRQREILQAGGTLLYVKNQEETL